jgi:hypothetical protein
VGEFDRGGCVNSEAGRVISRGRCANIRDEGGLVRRRQLGYLDIGGRVSSNEGGCELEIEGCVRSTEAGG